MMSESINLSMNLIDPVASRNSPVRRISWLGMTEPRTSSTESNPLGLPPLPTRSESAGFRRTRRIHRPGRLPATGVKLIASPPASTPDEPSLKSARDQTPSGRRLPFRPWEVILALFVLATLYASITSQVRFGPVWLLPLLFAGLLIALAIAHIQERLLVARKLALALVLVGTIAVEASVVTLVVRLIQESEAAPYLLRDAALLWIANVIVFGVWYWELDGGGPRARHTKGYHPTDLAFPQIQIEELKMGDWKPEFVDYFFVAFTASAAFSPTDTSFLSARSKLLLMLQAGGSIVILAVVAARAINILE
jgi:hypothetical protein